ncbi:MAG: hypothetical protein CMH52_11965 [Myxococcales bacterium]|nr:hypothetical protein [Myxococcales bacterium]
MKLDRYYQILVMGGFVLSNGCGGTPTEDDQTTVPRPTSQPKQATHLKQKPAEAVSATETALNCSEICTRESMTEMFCPESVESKQTNCCWLMPEPRHPCCDQLD